METKNNTPATSRSLYSIEMDYLRIADMLIDNGGEIDEETETALAINKDHLEVKASGFALLTKELDRKSDSIDAEIERLTKLKKSYSTASDRLKSAIENAMKLYGIDKIEGELIRLSFRKSSAVSITDENLITAEYKDKKETETISKTRIKDALKEGKQVAGACLVENKKLQVS